MQANGTTVGENEWLGRTGHTWANEWRRTDRSFAPLTGRLLQRAQEFAAVSVLDIGCGAGELSLAMAGDRPESRVVGVDISPQLVAAARERGARDGNVTFEVGDAAAWLPGAADRPDLLLSRHGVMFFDEPVTAFAHLRAIAAPRAALLFSCFRDRDDNALFREAGRLLPQPPPPPDPAAPGPFAFADPARVEAILRQSGWQDVRFEAFDFPMTVGAGSDPLDDAVQYFSMIGPAARAVRELGATDQEAFRLRARALAAANLRDGSVGLGAAVWIVTARAP